MEKTEQLFGLIFQASPNAMVLLDADGQILEVNPAGLVHLQEEDFARLQNTVLSGGTSLLEFEIAGSSGSNCWLEIHAAPVPTAQSDANLIFGVFRDITERKHNGTFYQDAVLEIGATGFVSKIDFVNGLMPIAEHLIAEKSASQNISL